MTDPQQYTRDPDEDLAGKARRVEALRDAIEHVSGAVGVLDTMPEARDLVPVVEKARKELTAKLRPLEREIAQAMDVQRTYRTRS